MDDADDGLADLAAVIEGPTMPPVQRGKALVTRTRFRFHQGDVASALADGHRVLNRSGAAPDQLMIAYVIKGLVAQSEGRSEEALDYLRALARCQASRPAWHIWRNSSYRRSLTCKVLCHAAIIGLLLGIFWQCRSSIIRRIGGRSKG